MRITIIKEVPDRGTWGKTTIIVTNLAADLQNPSSGSPGVVTAELLLEL